MEMKLNRDLRTSFHVHQRASPECFEGKIHFCFPWECQSNASKQTNDFDWSEVETTLRGLWMRIHYDPLKFFSDCAINLDKNLFCARECPSRCSKRLTVIVIFHSFNFESFLNFPMLRLHRVKRWAWERGEGGMFSSFAHRKSSSPVQNLSS